MPRHYTINAHLSGANQGTRSSCADSEELYARQSGIRLVKTGQLSLPTHYHNIEFLHETSFSGIRSPVTNWLGEDERNLYCLNPSQVHESHLEKCRKQQEHCVLNTRDPPVLACERKLQLHCVRPNPVVF